MHHRTSTDSIPVDVRYLLLYLLAKNHNMHHRTSTDSIRQSMNDICFVSLGQKNHNMHHRTSTDSIPVDVRCLPLYSLGQNHNMHHRTSTDSIHQSMCDVCLCILLARKSQHASSHIDRLDSPVDVRYRVLYSLGQKITTCIIAHRPTRFTSRCAI